VLGSRVETLSGSEKAAQLGHRLGMIGHRTAVCLTDDAVPVVLGAGAEPDGARVATQEFVGSRCCHDAASRREDDASAFGEEAGQCLVLEAAIVRLAVEAEDLGDREARVFLDLAVQLEKGDMETPRQPPADRGLAGAAEAEKRYRASVLHRLGGSQKRRGCRPEGLGQKAEVADGDVPFAGLDLDQEAGRKPGALGEVLQRQAVLRAQPSHGLTQMIEEALLRHGAQYNAYWGVERSTIVLDSPARAG
jgi:hypothetical protein